MATSRATMVKPSGSILEELEARKEATRKGRGTIIVKQDSSNSSQPTLNDQHGEEVIARKPRNTVVSKDQRAIIPQTIEYPTAQNGNEVPSGYAVRQHRPTLMPKKSSEPRDVQSTQSEASALVSPNAKARQLRVGTDDGFAELTSTALRPSPPRVAQSSANKATAECRNEKKGLVASLREAVQHPKEEIFPLASYIDSLIQSALVNVAASESSS